MPEFKKPKVVLVASFTYPYHAGGGLNAFNFGKFMIAKGIPTQLLTFNRNLKLSAYTIIDGLKITRIPYFNRGIFLKIVSLFIIIPYYIHKVLFNDIIIIYGGFIIGWELIPLLGRIFNKRVIFRSTMFGEDDIENLLKYNNILKPIRKFSLKQIRNYIALTPAFSLSYKKYFKEITKIIESGQGTNTEIFYPVDSKQKQKIREKLNMAEKEFVIISVGSVTKRKGYERIYQELLKLDFPFTYIVLGDYDFSDENLPIKRVLRSLEIYRHGKQLLGDKILFKGFINNVEEYLQASDIFLTASSKEGLSNALLEAMACGLAVIANDLNAIKDFLLFHKSNCICFEQEMEIGNSIKLLSENTEMRKELGCKAVLTIQTNFSFQHLLDRLLIK